MSLNYPNVINAVGSTDGAGAPVWIAGASVASPGAGVYNYTLDQPLHASQACCIATARHAVPAAGHQFTPTWVHTSDTVKQLTWTDNGVAAAIDHDFVIMMAPLS